jgi:hypothetical protein
LTSASQRVAAVLGYTVAGSARNIVPDGIGAWTVASGKHVVLVVIVIVVNNHRLSIIDRRERIHEGAVTVSETEGVVSHSEAVIAKGTHEWAIEAPWAETVAKTEGRVKVEV